jgi:GTPase SAR1 family protein
MDFRDALQSAYRNKLQPVERKLPHSKSMDKPEALLVAKPTVMVVGPTSSGKTTFIEYILQGHYPGSNIGPEPTTDNFTILLDADGKGEHIIPGDTLVANKSFPFMRLAEFGKPFVGCLKASMMKSNLLKDLTFIDTPGVLSTEKEVSRGYNLSEAICKLAEDVDMILLVFDINRLDISSEMQRIVKDIYGNGHKDKVHIILNKADEKPPLEHQRAYGALMWSLGQVILTSEIPRVYVGSFWDHELKNAHFKIVFEESLAQLNDKFSQVADANAHRKFQEMLLRAKTIKVRMHLLEYLKTKRSGLKLMWSAKRQNAIFNELSLDTPLDKDKQVTLGQLLDDNALEVIKTELKEIDFWEIPNCVPLMPPLDELITQDLPKIVELIPMDKTPECQKAGVIRASTGGC